MKSEVSIGHQTYLAKLLARENLTVVTGNFRTAYFDVKNRILGLPTFVNVDKAVYDLFVGHEVGHAMFTPLEAFNEQNISKDVLNVIEDIRIERLILDAYPGLGECFRSGYRQLFDLKFFGIDENEFKTLGLIDRINVRAKMRGVIEFKLLPDEEAFYQKCYAAQTIEDVVSLCHELQAMAKAKNTAPKKSPPPLPFPCPPPPAPPSSGDVSADSDSDDADNTDEETSGEKQKSKAPQDIGNDADDDDDADDDGTEASSTPADVESEDESQQDEYKSASGEYEDEDETSLKDDLSSKTSASFNAGVQSKVKFDASTVTLIEPSKKNIKNCIVPYEKVKAARRSNEKNLHFTTTEKFIEAKLDFKRRANKQVSLLAREFEMRRKAYQYSRAKDSKTGLLNLDRLHSHKYSEDIFRSVTVLANAKNHGLVMFIDYSDSMSSILSAVLEQTLFLSMFCKSVGIPFEVYGFTTPRTYANDIYDHASYGEMIVTGRIHLVEQLNSRMSKAEFNEAVTDLFAVSYYASRKILFSQESEGLDHVRGVYDHLHGTPLLECVVAAHHIVSEFKRKTSIQKCAVIFLTDGAGTALNQYGCKSYPEGVSSHTKFNSKMSVNGGKYFSISSNTYRLQYTSLIENLRVTCGVTVIGFYIGEGRGATQYIRETAVNQIDRDKLLTDLRRNRCAIAYEGKICGYDVMYVLPEITSSNGDFDVDLTEEEATDSGFTSKRSVNKIASAFLNSASEKKRARLILQSFAEIIS